MGQSISPQPRRSFFLSVNDLDDLVMVAGEQVLNLGPKTQAYEKLRKSLLESDLRR